jgi:hypothetical protein
MEIFCVGEKLAEKGKLLFSTKVEVRLMDRV